jgi:hypothetical protein
MASVDVNRYTSDGPDAAEKRIARDQVIIGAAVRNALKDSGFVALILAGGYGRGEGGYRVVGDQYLPYNDYDYFVVVRGGRQTAREVAAVLSGLAHELEALIGVEVDFAVLRQSRLPHLAHTLMYAELRYGHKVVAGDPSVLNMMRPMPCDRVPLAEFSRLMLNRGSLLLMNRRMLKAGGPCCESEREQFVRYLDKALLACADARLAAVGRYDPFYQVKRDRLASLHWTGSRDFISRYEEALKSRTGTGRVIPQGQEAAAQALVVADWLEALAELEPKRHGILPAWRDYSTPRIGKGQSAPGILGIVRNVAVTARDFGIPELFRNASWALRYPRERLISVLPALLEPSLDVPEGALSDALAQPGNVDRAHLSHRFLDFWQRYN